MIMNLGKSRNVVGFIDITNEAKEPPGCIGIPLGLRNM